MKPPAFEYTRARTTKEAVELMRELGSDGRILAGGQSLVPMMNLRINRPPHLVDLNFVDDLPAVEPDSDHLVLGALARQAAVEWSTEAKRHVPMLAEALAGLASPPVRHRGTVVGSLAHASPIAQLPCVAVALGARLTLASLTGTRTISAQDFLLGPFRTALESDEVVTQVAFPVAAPGTGQCFVAFGAVNGHHPVVCVAASITLDDGAVNECRIGIAGVGGYAVRADEAERLLRGRAPGAEIIDQCVTATVDRLESEDPADTALLHILPVRSNVPTYEYRIRLLQTQLGRAIAVAARRAGGGESRG